MNINTNKWKLKTKFTIDIFLIITFIFNVITALMLLFNTGGGAYWRSSGIINLLNFSNRSSLRLIHDWTGLLIIALILFHLILNWRTIVCYFKNLLSSAAKVAKIEQTCKNI
ncbi:MAG: DUF4405 domain-containing protein [Actinobacteria bacterium]|nr:DUF4405 domain-containing protein [Cyanobacteriota bacterium]MCL5772496.1 DUF4405 domain-containing protein [Actinomycetota bacterium]